MKPTDTHSYSLEAWRFRILYILMGLIFGFYAIRLFSMQIIDGADYLTRANDNRTSQISVTTERGIIFDRNGYVLARNKPYYNVVITPAELPSDAGTVQEIFRQLSDLIGVPVNNGEVTDETARLFSPCRTTFGITQIVEIADSTKPYDPVKVKCGVDAQLALIINEHHTDWPGVSISVEAVREYTTGSLTAAVVGFMGPVPATEEQYWRDQGLVPGRDKVGYAGVEQSMQDLLMGTNGTRVVEVDGAGQEIRDLEEPIPAIPGENIQLTIDTRLQAAAEAALIGEIDYWNTRMNKIISSNGVVIAINPRTGEVLALVTYPTYENNRMAEQIPGDYYEQLLNDPNKPLLNHAISARHPPGSVFKIAAAIGILNEGVVTPDFEVFDPGSITIMQKFSQNDAGTPREYVCHEEAGHGWVNFFKGVSESCDVYFYKVGGGFEDEVPNGGLGIWRLAEYARALGFGQVTGIELPGEIDGLIPDPTWKRLTQGENWSTGDTYIATIGQGFVLATPIQVLMAYATLANDGQRMRPTLLEQVMDADGNVVQPFTPDVAWDVTQDPMIRIFDEDDLPTGLYRTIEPWVIATTKEAMRMVVTTGTSESVFESAEGVYQSAGKTGTAEYCDQTAQEKKLCSFGNWPAHAWYVGYAPYDNPEIAVVAFVYNGTEGSTVAAPIVRNVMDAYFELKAIDAAAEAAQ